MSEMTKEKLADLVSLKLMEMGDNDGMDYLNGDDAVGLEEFIKVADELLSDKEVSFEVVEQDGGDIIAFVDFVIGSFGYRVICGSCNEDDICSPDDIINELFDMQQRYEVIAACTLPICDVIGE